MYMAEIWHFPARNTDCRHYCGWHSSVVFIACWHSGREVRGSHLGPGLFYWVAALASCFLTLPSQTIQLQETWVQKRVFGLDRFNGLTDLSALD